MQSINTKSTKLDNFVFIAVLILFSMVSLVPFFAMKHIKIMNLPMHYLIVGGIVGILAILTLYNQRWKLTSFDKWLFLLMLSFLLSIITSVNKIYTLQSLASFFLRGIGVAFVVHKIVITEERKNQLVLVLLLVASVVSLIGLAEYFAGGINPLFHKLYLEGKASWYPIALTPRSGMISTIGHPLSLSAYLVLLLPFTFLCFYNRKSIFRFLPFVILLLTIILSFSRSSWIAAFLVLVIYFCKEKAMIRNNRKEILVILMILSLVFFTFPKLRYTFLGRVDLKRIKSEDGFGAISHRFHSYRTTFNIFKKHPLFGVGMGNYPKVHIAYRAEGTGEKVETPDNMYLRFICETGLVGTLTFFCFIFYWLYQFWRNRNDIFIWTIFASLVGFLINQMFGDFFYWLPTQFLFWFMLGLGVGIKGSNCEDG